MAEEKKEPPKTIGTATTIRDWVTAYYGDDAIDYSKKNKVRHSIRVCQFASVVAIVTKNSKKAHTDFFESSYTAVDTTYVKAAELIVRLIETKYRENRPLTMEDFKNCGGKDLFDGRPNFDEICEDYIGKGGMVEMGEMSFPSPKGQDLRREKESFKDFDKWLKESTDYEKDERALEKRRLMYGSMVDDLDDVKSDFEQLLQLASPEERNSGALNGKTLHEIYNAVTDKAAKMQRELKGKKSSLDFDVRDDIEAAVAIRYEAAKKTAKVAALGGVTAASLGAVVGGVFWPAFLVIPVYALAKKWLPDWAKSLGEMWGHFEKSLKTRYERQKVDSYYHYLVSFMETGGKPKIRFKDRFFLTKDVIKCLKKGAKSGSVGATFEDNDGITRKSEIDRAKETTSIAFGNYLKDTDKVVAVDKQALLDNGLSQISKDDATFGQFIELASRYEEYQTGLDPEAKLGFQVKYANKLNESAEHLIFETPMKSMTHFQDLVATSLADDGKILSSIKDVASHDVVPRIARLRTFASKELSGVNADECKGKTLAEFINREVAEIPAANASDGTFVNPTDAHLEQAITWINALIRDPKDEHRVIVNPGIAMGVDSKPISVDKINAEIGRIAEAKDKDRCSKLLQAKMENVFLIETRADARLTFKALTSGDFGGKMADLAEFFKQAGEMNYENIDSMTFSTLVYNVTGSSKITPPEAGRYLRDRLSKSARDIFATYINQDGIRQKFSEDLKSLTTYLQKINGCSLLNSAQKASLSAGAKGYVTEAFDRFIKDMSNDFMGVYDRKTVDNYIDSEYISGGFKTLFRTDSSAEVLKIKNKLDCLSSLNSAHQNLKLNGYNMSATDQQIIGKILLRDSVDGFDSVKVRGAGDKLVDFLSNKLNTSKNYLSFAGVDVSNIENEITRDGTPYKEIKQKLSFITTGDMSTSDYFDKYAALIALKNRTVVEFRQCLSKLVTSKCGSDRPNDWLQTEEGKSLYSKAIEVWGKGLFADIDKAFEDIKTLARAGMTAAEQAEFNAKITKLGDPTALSNEIKRYSSAYEYGLSEEKSLGA